MISRRIAGVERTGRIVGAIAAVCGPVAGVAASQGGVMDSARTAVRGGAVDAWSAIRDDPWTWVHVVAAIVVLAVLGAVGVLRPGTLKGGRDVSPHPWGIWLACGLIVLGTSWVGGGIVATLLGLAEVARTGEDESSIMASLTLREQGMVSVCGYAMAVTAALVMRRILAMSAPRAGLEWRGDAWVRGGVAAVLVWPVVQAAAIAATWVVLRAGGEAPPRVAHTTLQTILDSRDDPWAWALAATAIVGAPIVEEFVFRVGLQSAALRLFGKPWVAIVLSAAAFAAIHMGDPRTAQWPAMAALATLGLCLGFAYEKTRSFLVPIIIHAVFNAANVGLALASN